MQASTCSRVVRRQVLLGFIRLQVPIVTRRDEVQRHMCLAKRLAMAACHSGLQVPITHLPGILMVSGSQVMKQKEGDDADNLLGALKSMSIASYQVEATGSVLVLNKGRVVQPSIIIEIKT